MKKTLFIIGCIIVLTMFLIFIKSFGLFTSIIRGSATNPGGYDKEFKLPLSEISENAKWYEYKSNGVTIRFFAVKASDGSMKTGFDACDVCYRNRKGYRQEGNYMVCNNCGNRYPIIGLGTENKNPGGCWPSYLPSKIDGQNLVIKKSDLERGRSRFA